jgi:hypothetical protein
MTTPAKTNISPVEQIRNISTYDDQLAAGAGLETTTASLEDNVQAVISQLNRAFSGVATGNNWYTDTVTPTGLGDTGTQRGVNNLNTDLHLIERKRVLKRRAMVGVDVPDPGAAQSVILVAADLPTTTTAAIGAVTTLGTVVATATTFGTASASDVVAGANSLQPKNLQVLTNNATGDVVTRVSDGKQIFGLFQSESATDGSTITATTPNRVQISFVVHNATNDGLTLIAASDMSGIVFDYAYVERHALEDLSEESFLGDGFADTGVSAATRQASYDNQGPTVVTTVANATLDVGTGLFWELGDVASATMLRLTEGSTGGTTTFLVGSDVDVYNNNAIDVNFNNGITVDNGSDAINIGVTVDQIDFTGNATITATSGSSVTVNATAANASLTTTTSGNVVVTSAGLVDVNSTTTVTVDGTGISIDGTAASNFSVTGGDLVLSTITTGELDMTSAGLMDVNAGANLDIDVTGTYDMLSTGAFSIDGTGASNVSVASGDLTISTTTTGNLALTGAVNVDVTSGTGDVDITAATSVDVSAGTSVSVLSGASDDISVTAGRNLLLTADVAEFDVSSQDVGHWLDNADFHYFGDTNRGDNYLTVNAQYVSATGTSGGWVKVTSAATVTNGTIASTTAGVAATSNPVITTTGITGLAAGTIIIVEGATPRSLDGIYEVLSGAAAAMTIRGIGLTDTVEDFTKRQVETAGAASGTVFTATLAVMRNSSTGVFEVAVGSTTPLSFSTLATGTSTLQQAYEAGNTVSVTTAEGTIDFSNSTDATDVLTVSRTFAGAGEAITLNMGASTTGIGFDVNITAGATGNAVDVANAGGGDAVFVNNTGAGAALTIQDGGTDVLDVAATGAVTITPTSGTNATITVAGAGVVDVNAGAGGVTVDATAGSIALATTTSGNITAASAGTFLADAAGVLELNSSGAAISIGNDADAFAINVGTGAAARTVTVGNATGATALDFNSGTGGVTIDTVSGGISIDAAAGASNFTVAGAALTLSTTTSGDVVVAAATNVDVDGTAVTIDATAGVSVDAATASNFTVTGADLILSTVTTGELDLTSAGLMDVNAGANLDIDVTGTYDMLSTGVFSIDGTGASNVSATSGNLVLSTITSGDVQVTGAAGVSISAATNVVVTNTTGYTTINSQDTRINVTNLAHAAASAAGVADVVASRNYWANGTNGNLFHTLGTGYTSSSGTISGTVYVVSATSSPIDTVAGAGFTAGVPASSDCTVVTAGTGTFTAGDFLLITHPGGATARENLGIFQLLTDGGTTLTMRGPFTAVSTGAEFVARQFVTDATTGASIQRVTLSVIRINSSGQAEVAENFSNLSGISYQGIGTGAVTLSNAVTNVGTSPALQSATFVWQVDDTESLTFEGVTANADLLKLAHTSGADVVTIGHGTGDLFDGLAATNNFFFGAVFDSATSGGAPPAQGIRVGTTSGEISTIAGDLLVYAAGGPTPSAATVRGGDGSPGSSIGGELFLRGGASAGTGAGVVAGGANLTGGAYTGGDSTGAGGVVNIDGGASATGPGGAVTINGGTGDTVAGTVTVTGGSATGTAIAGGAVTINGGTPTDGAGATLTFAASAGVGTNRAGGAITTTAGNATGTAAAGSISVTAGQSVTGAAGTFTATGGAGGSTSGVGGQVAIIGGAGTAGNAGGGQARVFGGAGQGTATGGGVTLTAGAGGATGAGGAVAINGGVGGATSGNAGGVTVTGGTPVVGDGGAISVSGSAGVGTNQAGGAVTVTGGASVGTGAAGDVTLTGGSAGATGTQGFVHVRNASNANVTQATTVLRLSNQGSGTGGGEVMSVYTGTAAPTHSASTGSLALFDNASTGRLYVNESTGGSGTTWSQVQTASTTVTRNFFQDTFSTGVTAPGTITTGVLTGGVLPVKPSTGFSFNTDAMVFLNGILLMNGTGNEITSGTGNEINILTAGPSAVTGDVLTVVYHTNSTSNTA